MYITRICLDGVSSGEQVLMTRLWKVSWVHWRACGALRGDHSAPAARQCVQQLRQMRSAILCIRLHLSSVILLRRCLLRLRAEPVARRVCGVQDGGQVAGAGGQPDDAVDHAVRLAHGGADDETPLGHPQGPPSPFRPPALHDCSRLPEAIPQKDPALKPLEGAGAYCSALSGVLGAGAR